jgi:hypothetical protein
LFTKKPTVQSNLPTVNNGKNVQSTANTNLNNVLTKKEEKDNNEAFKIEDDIDNNDLSFHINNEDDDEEEEEVKTSPTEKVKEETKVEKVSANKSVSASNEKMLKEIEESDISTFVHKVYMKVYDSLSQGSLLDIEGFPSIHCKKVKKKNKILSFMGIGKNKKEETLNYILLFDDNFIYFIKDENNNPDKSNVNMKKVGNRYNIRLISNVIFKVR